MLSIHEFSVELRGFAETADFMTLHENLLNVL